MYLREGVDGGRVGVGWQPRIVHVVVGARLLQAVAISVVNVAT